MVKAAEFESLIYWLGRFDDKGHLENCPDLVEPWSEFEYREAVEPKQEGNDGRDYEMQAMNAKVIPIGCITRLDLDADLMLENRKGELEGFVIVGYGKDGSEFFAATYADGGTALWLIERLKMQLLEVEP